MKLCLLAEAEAEIESAQCYLNRQSVELGVRFPDELDRTLRDILDHPTNFPKLETVPDDAQYKRARLKSFRYAVIFELHADEILVVAVAHTSRRPNYWLKRQQALLFVAQEESNLNSLNGNSSDRVRGSIRRRVIWAKTGDNQVVAMNDFVVGNRPQCTSDFVLPLAGNCVRGRCIVVRQPLREFVAVPIDQRYDLALGEVAVDADNADRQQ